MSRFITDKVEEMLAVMMIGNLMEYADIEDESGDTESANNLRNIANQIQNGTATEDEWIEAIEQMSCTDRYYEQLNW